MSGSPYPVDGTLYYNDGTTKLASVLVICKNVNKNETLTQTTNASGQFMFELTDFTSGYKLGDEISLMASYGNYYDEVIFTVAGGFKEQDLTLDIELPTASVYTTVTDVRNFTGVSSSEFSDNAVYGLIRRSTNVIDELSGRTWRGVQTVTDELYDGDDTDMLWLDNTDIQSVTAVSIDDNQDATYTDITTTYVYVYSEGYIILGRNAELTSFVAAGPQSVKVSYTHGIASPSETVRELCLLMVANKMHFDPERKKMIDSLLNKLKWKARGLA